MRNKKTLRNKKKIRSKQKGGTDKGEEGPDTESAKTTQPARRVRVFEIYSCLQEKYPDAASWLPIPGFLETVGYENIPVNANFSNYLSGVLKEKLNKDFKEYLPKESEASQYDIKSGELKNLQKKIKAENKGTHIICGHHNNMKENMKNILNPMSVLKKNKDLNVENATINVTNHSEDPSEKDTLDLNYEGWHNNTAFIMEETNAFKIKCTFVVPMYDFKGTKIKEGVLIEPTGVNEKNIGEIISENFGKKNSDEFYYKPLISKFAMKTFTIDISKSESDYLKPYRDEANKYFESLNYKGKEGGKGEKGEKGKIVCIIRHGAAFHNTDPSVLKKVGSPYIYRDSALLPSTVLRTVCQGQFFEKNNIISDKENISLYMSPLLRSQQTLYYLLKGINKENAKDKKEWLNELLEKRMERRINKENDKDNWLNNLLKKIMESTVEDDLAAAAAAAAGAAEDDLAVDSDEEDRGIDLSQRMVAPPSVEYESHIGKLPVEYDNEIRKFTSKFSISGKNLELSLMVSAADVGNERIAKAASSEKNLELSDTDDRENQIRAEAAKAAKAASSEKNLELSDTDDRENQIRAEAAKAADEKDDSSKE
jgi:hypothetical protein